jgi:hypothetical protein
MFYTARCFQSGGVGATASAHIGMEEGAVSGGLNEEEEVAEEEEEEEFT